MKCGGSHREGAAGGLAGLPYGDNGAGTHYSLGPIRWGSSRTQVAQGEAVPSDWGGS